MSTTSIERQAKLEGAKNFFYVRRIKVDEISQSSGVFYIVFAVEHSIVDVDSENRERFSRISLVIIDILTNILRDILRSKIPPTELYQKCMPYLNYFNLDQQTRLHELQLPNTYESFDISLIYKLLRQFLLIPPPTKGWGNVPDTTDTNLAADVERIRCYRNQMVYRCSTNIEQDAFEFYFDQFRDIGHRMDLIFFNKRNYEGTIDRYKTCRMDDQMQIKYENALKKLENVTLRFEKRPIKFYWGENFDRCLKDLRSLLKDEKLEGRRNVRLQIVLHTEADVERTADIMNTLRDEINESLSGKEFIVATKRSLIIDIKIILDMFETDEMLQSTLASFLEKIMAHIMTSNTENINMVLFPVEEYTTLNETNANEEPI
ncbi:uncharacterized protein LOC127705591 [Mytilus californianus]|uniref:uncharacterized protein LOC127705591 n=1 Tax=Mytilus californianus TaxID=6549 RepID=UPI002247C4B9|nr:uncharacterized protein LOC127705591 [Mytilus californianus]